MSGDPVRKIAQSVLYEGYLLWPYRRSALKNQQRFTFGGVYPEAFARTGGDRSTLRMECLVEGPAEARIELELRCLQLVSRRPARRSGAKLEEVDELVAGGERYLAWDEATERELTAGPAPLAELAETARVAVDLPAGEEVEELVKERGSVPQYVLVRRWQRLEGELAWGARELRPGLHRLEVSFSNGSGFDGGVREQALAHTFLSTHLVARADGAAFVSQTDPPEDLRHEAEPCRNDGVWPVLVGEEGDRQMLLGSPIILSDYPAVAPESPGDLFDGGEIDALLIHSIRGLSDAERDEMRATDPRVREILDRSMGLSPEQMLDLYGAVRDMRPLER